jgi:ubiquinone/menaquinone biosynthesis C-methylase UbiE
MIVFTVHLECGAGAMGEDHVESLEERIHFLEKQEVIVLDFQASGWILDIGGGGEGVIGQLKGRQVVAIDPKPSELEEAASGPLKIVMNARELQFLDETFEFVTSFFTLMYIKAPDQKQVFEEVFRVLKPKGKFLIWDIELPLRLPVEQDIVAFYLRITLPDRQIETGYGTHWPEQLKNLPHYREIAESIGFVPTAQRENGRQFTLELQKP